MEVRIIKNNDFKDDLIKRSYEITYRAKTVDYKKIIQGYAVVFNTWTDINNGWDKCWSECICKGAFAKSLKNNSILALYNHDFNNVIARKDINMKLIEEDKGLYFEIELPNTTQANDLYELINRGIVNQRSFAGYVTKHTWGVSDGKSYREIQEVDLIEITITPIPAYEVTEAEVKRNRELKGKGNVRSEYMDLDIIISEAKQKLNEIKNYDRRLK